MKKRLQTQLCLTLLAFWLPSAGLCADVESRPELKSTSDLPNFHKVHSFLYRSGEPTAKGVQQCHDLGIKTLIDLRATGERTRREAAWGQELGMKYINLPMSDKAPTKSQVDTFMETVKQAKKDNAPVLVHCAHGSDRTGCLVGIWRVSEDGFTYDQAYKEMRRYYFGPQFKQLSGAVKARAR